MMRLVVLFLFGLTGCFSPASGYVLDSKDPIDLEVAKASALEWSRGGYELPVRLGVESVGDEYLISWKRDGGDGHTVGHTEYGDHRIYLYEGDEIPWFRGHGPCSGFDLQTVLAHEMGHSLGMDHTPSPLDTMYYKQEWCQFKHELTDEDINQ